MDIGQVSSPQSAVVAIALGSNLGNSYRILTEAIVFLHESPHIQVLQHSQFYRTVPIGPPQPDYLNACAILRVNISPFALLTQLLVIERHFGRVRRERWGPRLLDLDLIFYDQLILNTPQLQIPHPRLTERAFVLVPLAEIAGQWRDPITGKSIQELVERIDRSGVLPYRY